MKINQVSFGHKNSNNKPNFVKITGYGAIASGVGSVVAIKNKKPKLHKSLGYLAGIFTLAHIGILKWYHFQARKNFN